MRLPKPTRSEQEDFNSAAKRFEILDSGTIRHAYIYIHVKGNIGKLCI